MAGVKSSWEEQVACNTLNTVVNQVLLDVLCCAISVVGWLDIDVLIVQICLNMFCIASDTNALSKNLFATHQLMLVCCKKCRSCKIG